MAEESNQMGRHLSKMSAANTKRLRDELRLRESKKMERHGLETIESQAKIDTTKFDPELENL